MNNSLYAFIKWDRFYVKFGTFYDQLQAFNSKMPQTFSDIFDFTLLE